MKRFTVLLVLITVVLSGCLGTGINRGTGPKAAKGILAFTIWVAGEGELSTQSAQPVIERYKVYLKGASKSLIEEFAGNEPTMAIELDIGFWDVQVEAIDTKDIVRFSSQPETVEVLADSMTTMEVILYPSVAYLHVKLDVSNLFAAGLKPEVVDVYVKAPVDSQTSHHPIGLWQLVDTAEFSIRTPQTVDLILEAKTADERILARQVLTGIDLFPGETVEVEWTPNPLQQGGGKLEIGGVLLAPLEPPTEFAVTWNPVTQRLDMSLIEPSLPVGGEVSYVLEVQEAPDEPFSVWRSVHGQPGSDKVPSGWRGKTIRIRASVEWRDDRIERRSIATSPVEVAIPGNREQVNFVVERFFQGYNELDSEMILSTLMDEIRLVAEYADPEMESESITLLSSEFAESVVKRGFDPGKLIVEHIDVETAEVGFQITVKTLLVAEHREGGKGKLKIEVVLDQNNTWKIRAIHQYIDYAVDEPAD